MVQGKKKIGRLDRDWVIVQLLENAPYSEIVKIIGFPALVEGWPQWRDKFLLDEWLPRHHPEFL